jgi:hypothetical protein
MTESPSVVDVARSFVLAVAWGEHRTVWALLGVDARKAVLQVALTRGMDDVLAGRLRDATASPREYDEFLTDLVNGLRADLAGADLDSPVFQIIEGAADDGHAAVVLATATPTELARHGIDNLPVATINLVFEGDEWKIARVDPRLSR